MWMLPGSRCPSKRAKNHWKRSRFRVRSATPVRFPIVSVLPVHSARRGAQHRSIAPCHALPRQLVLPFQPLCLLPPNSLKPVPEIPFPSSNLRQRDCSPKSTNVDFGKRLIDHTKGLVDLQAGSWSLIAERTFSQYWYSTSSHFLCQIYDNPKCKSSYQTTLPCCYRNFHRAESPVLAKNVGILTLPNRPALQCPLSFGSRGSGAC